MTEENNNGNLSAVSSTSTTSTDTTTSVSSSYLADTNFVIRQRSAWHAAPPREIYPLKISPVPYVIIHHTYNPSFCNTSAKCQDAILSIQKLHQYQRGWLDIGYSFIIGGDGVVYEGRGWDRDGAHAPKYNDKSIGIAFIGDFRHQLPTKEMIIAAKELIEFGKKQGHIREDYSLLGHRQVRDTICPGDALFNEISTWPQFITKSPL